MKNQTDDQTGQESIVKADAKRSKLQSFKLRAIVIAIIGIIVATIALCMLVYGGIESVTPSAQATYSSSVQNLTAPIAQAQFAATVSLFFAIVSSSIASISVVFWILSSLLVDYRES